MSVSERVGLVLIATIVLLCAGVGAVPPWVAAVFFIVLAGAAARIS